MIEAERAFEEALAPARRLENDAFGYIMLYNLAQLALGRGDLKKAALMLREGIESSGQTKDTANLAHFLSMLTAVEALRGRAEHSALLLGAAEALLQEVGATVYNFTVWTPHSRNMRWVKHAPFSATRFSRRLASEGGR